MRKLFMGKNFFVEKQKLIIYLRVGLLKVLGYVEMRIVVSLGENLSVVSFGGMLG